jgi:hypothetical protein
MFKKILYFIIAFSLTIPLLFVATEEVEAKCHWVKGHYRSGKWVSGYWRDCGNGDSDTNDAKSEFKSPSKNIVNLYKGTGYVGSSNANQLVFVEGYYRKDGTYVRPHYRTHENSFIVDNFSYKGISTLLPLEKNKLTLNSNKTVAATELYLYSIVGNKQLSNIQIQDLKTYAKELSSLKDKNLQEVKKLGIKFYQDLKFNSFFAEKQFEFDSKGNMGIEGFVYQSLIQMGVTNLTLDQQSKLDEYITKLSELLINKGNNLSVKFAGENLYKLLGFSSYDSSFQSEMDILQVTNILISSRSPVDYEEIKAYLTYIAARDYDIKLSIDQFVKMLSYAFYLESAKKYPGWGLNDAIKKGDIYYNSLGLSEENINKQIKIDLDWILN